MSIVDPKLVAARLEAEAARDRLMQSVHELQGRIAPSRLANDALEGAKERGAAAVETVTAAARQRPGLFAAAGASIVALAARRPILRLIRRKRSPQLPPPPPPPQSKRALPRPSGDKQ